jgi:hypothetical protein
LDQRFSSWLLKCTESNTFSFSLFNCFGYKTFNAFKFITELSIISPDLSGVLAFKTVVLPSFPQFNFTSVASAMVMDFHFRKNHHFPSTFVLNQQTKHPSNEDVLCKVLTALGALRSEFPSRKTGFTAEPKTLNILL